MDSFEPCNCSHAAIQDKASNNNIEVINVFDQYSDKSLQQLMEDALIHHLNSDIDNDTVTRYTNINSR